MKPEDMVIDDQIRQQVITGLIDKIKAIYVFPDIAEQIASLILVRNENKEYSQLSSAAELTVTLTAHMREINSDKHLRLRYSEETLVVTETEDEDDEDPILINQEKERQAHLNYGLYKIERLPGNIGYMDIRNFHDPASGGEKIAAAMSFLSDTSALIIDLRQNGGGYPGMVALLCSYFFDSKPVHLNSLYYRGDDFTFQSWTLPYVPGKKYLDKPVYLLTSNYTFSAAEEFSYNLQQLRRVTIIGEITGGGANPGRNHVLHEHFHAFIPSGRAINPINQINWEGTGVHPDILTTKEEAYKTAYIEALNHVISSAKNHNQQDSIQRLKQEEAEEALKNL